MKKALIITLQSLLVLIAAAALFFMLWMPHNEGRNINSTVFEVYFNDPFLAYAYASSIAFFTVLYQMFEVLGQVGQNNTYSLANIKSMRIIKLSSSILVVLVTLPLAYLIIVRPEDDIAGGVAMALFMILVSSVVAIIASKLEKRLRSNTI